MSESDSFQAHLERALIGGLEPKTITIVEYDPAWPLRFQTEEMRIRHALGSAITGVEHIGSTAVPGLAAKPIIDVTVTVEKLENEAVYAPRFESIGYHLRVREPDHLMFRSHAKDVHVHMWLNDEDVRRHVVFRDWLREHPNDRVLYEEIKRELSKQSWNDMNYYAEAKSAVIADIMSRANAHSL